MIICQIGQGIVSAMLSNHDAMSIGDDLDMTYLRIFQPELIL